MSKHTAQEAAAGVVKTLQSSYMITNDTIECAVISGVRDAFKQFAELLDTEKEDDE